MFLRIGRRLAILGIAFGAITLGMAPSARAAFQIELQEAGFGALFIPVVPSPTGTPTIAFSGVYGDFFITVLSQSTNSPGAPDQGVIFGSTTQVQNLKKNQNPSNQPVGTNTLTITTSSNDFNSPSTNPLNFFSGASATFGTSGGSLGYQSYADAQNRLYTQTPAATFTPGPQGPISGSGPIPVSTNEATGLFANTGAHFSLSNVATITLKQGATAGTVLTDLAHLDPTNPTGFVQQVKRGTGGAILNYSDHTIVTPTPTPEPAAMALVVSGLPLFGLAWLRRRKAQA